MRKKKMSPMEDRISALPDEILTHILSFLPTKLAFTTSVLSKRWYPICYSLTTLHFNDEDENVETYLLFRRFVNNVLLSPRVQHRPIETLSLVSRSKCGWNPYCHYITAEWIKAAKRRGVMNLQLSTIRGHLQFFPDLFTISKTLVVLKIDGVVFERGVGSVDLPSLKTLHLIEVVFRQRDDVKKILNACSIVEDLIVISPVDYESSYPIGGFKTLLKVVKARFKVFDVPFSAIPNVEFLHIEDMERRVKDENINSYYRELPVFQNLINLKLTFVRYLGWAAVMEVLPYCPKLQSLAIDKLLYRPNSQEKWEPTEEPAPECVSLHLTTFSIGNFQIRSYDDDFDFAAYILQNARVLQVLTLHINSHSDESKKDQLFKRLSRCSRISPTCKIECNYSRLFVVPRNIYHL